MTSAVPNGWRQSVIEVALVCAAWIILFEFNKVLLQDIEESAFVNWIFLPAALRLVSVLVLGVPGALGLFLGALVTNHPLWALDISDAVALSLLSALCPLAAARLSKMILNLSDDLSGIKSDQIYALTLLGATTSCIPHHLYFYSTNKIQSLGEGLPAMLTGDIVGTVIALWIVSYTLKFLRRRPLNLSD